MGSRIDSDKLSSSLSEIQKRLEDLRVRCISDPGNAEEILSDALEQLQNTFEELSAADEELMQQNEELQRTSSDLQRALEEQRHLADDLALERGQLQAVVENMEEAVGIWSGEGNLVAINNATVKLYGFETKEQMLKHLSEYADVKVRTLDGRELPQNEWPPSRVLRGESFKNWELEQLIPSINKRFIGSNSGSPVRDVNGNVILGVNTVHDITALYDARRAAEEGQAKLQKANEELAAVNEELTVSNEDLQQSNRNFSALFNNKTVGLSYCKTIFDKHNHATDYFVLDVNPTYELMTGVPRNLIVGKKITEALPGVSQDLIDRHNKVAVTGEDNRFEIYDSVTDRWYDVDVFSPQKGYFIAVFYNITERKKAEEALRESEEHYRLLFSSMTEMFLIVEPVYDQDGMPVDYTFLDVNPAYERFVGKPRELLVGRSARVVFGIVEDYWVKLFARVAKTGEPAHYESYGAEHGRTYELHAWRIGEHQVAFIVNDVSERKRAEEALRESEDRFRKVFEHAAFGMTLSDMEGRILESNPALEHILGYSKEELHYKSFTEFTHPDDLMIEWPQIEKLIAGQIDHYEIEKRYIRKDGKIICVRLVGSLTRDISGKPSVSIALIEDITDRKKAEEELRARDHRINEILESIQDDFYVLDRDWRFVYASKNFTSRIGKDPKDFVGKNIWEMFPKHLGTILEENYRAAMETREIREFELHGQYTDYWYRMKVYPSEEGITLLGTEITERKRAEEALRQSESRYRMLHESLRDPFVQVSMDGRIIEFNDLYCQMLGYSPEELRMLTYRDLTPERWHASEETIVREQIIGRGYSDVYQKEYRRKDGTIIPVELRTILSRDEEGRPSSMWGIVRDITERKKAENALRESEEIARQRSEELARLRDITPAAIWVSNDPQCSTIIGNKAANRFYEATEGDNLSAGTIGGEQNFTRRFFQKGRELKPEELPMQLAAAKGIDVIDSEVDVLLPSGKSITILGNARPLFDANGDVRGSIAVFVDITERKKMEEALRKAKDDLEQRVLERTAELTKANLALRKSEDRFRVALKNSPIVVFNQDRDLRYTWLHNPNPAFIGDIPLGKTDKEILPPEDAAQLTKIKRRVLESGHGERAEVKTTFNGVEFFYDLTVEPLRNASGEIEGITCASMDVTYRKNAEEELKRAKEAAEAAARAKSEFLANMSHEIRTPMNAIIGMTGLMLEEPLDPFQRENLELVRTNGDSLLSIINDILDFSKIESDKVVLEEYGFDLRQCVEEAVDLVAIRAAEKGLNLVYIIDKGVPDTITSDLGRLRQVLGNLLSNAVKFTDEGEVVLSVSSKQVDGTNEVHFAVQDTGIGIPQDSMGLLFQPFNQMEPSTTRLYGGTGLGLVISKKLVEMMGGRIWAQSEEGKGSTFHFTIKASSGQVEPEAATVSPQLIGKHVLVIEDNKTNRRVLSRQVYDWGMVPIAVTSGQEALRWVQRGDNFDIAILDMDLQDMDALGLEEKIRKYNKTLPLVLLISLGKRVPPNHAYLTKPIKPSQMHKVLTDVLPRTGILSVQPAQKTGKASGVDQPIQNSPLRILLAEDNVSSQKVALQMLKKLGYKADVVANGIEALQSLERQHYDVVLMDLKMPEMDGLEVSRIIRQRWLHDGPKIIAITAYALEGDREKCLAAGMDDYIAKPIEINDLRAVLERNFIDRKTTER